MTLNDKGHAPEKHKELINKAISLIIKLDEKQLKKALEIALGV